ncbi:MAG: hypothetical protein Q8M02_13300 [Candidatus Didemnitutus sp.]|nr:hypothetical protein [Candidatus Didemnitutus sp.]
MNARVPGGGRLWLRWVCGAAVLVAVLAVRHFRPVNPGTGVSEASHLRRELAALPPPVEPGAIRPVPSAAAALASARQALGDGWTVEASTRREFRCTAVQPGDLRWHELVSLIEALEQPGIGVQAIRIETRGNRTVRQFRSVEITFRLTAETRPLNPVRPLASPAVGPRSGRRSARRRETGSEPCAAGPPPPPPAPGATGSGSQAMRRCGRPGLPRAAVQFHPPIQTSTP